MINYGNKMWERDDVQKLVIGTPIREGPYMKTDDGKTGVVLSDPDIETVPDEGASADKKNLPASSPLAADTSQAARRRNFKIMSSNIAVSREHGAAELPARGRAIWQQGGVGKNAPNQGKVRLRLKDGSLTDHIDASTLQRPSRQDITDYEAAPWVSNIAKLRTQFNDTTIYPCESRDGTSSGYISQTTLDELPLREDDPFFILDERHAKLDVRAQGWHTTRGNGSRMPQHFIDSFSNTRALETWGGSKGRRKYARRRLSKKKKSKNKKKKTKRRRRR